ncbi:MAG: hypothetical protein ABI539_05265 [Acidobacteriota bacterium]
MVTISEAEFVRICQGVRDDREAIVKHNPIGSRDEILFWMVLMCLVSYLNLSDIDTPCFTGRPDAKTYRKAIEYVIRNRWSAPFEVAPHLEDLISK